MYLIIDFYYYPLIIILGENKIYLKIHLNLNDLEIKGNYPLKYYQFFHLTL